MEDKTQLKWNMENAFLNGAQCSILIEDRIKDQAGKLLFEVMDNLERPVLNIDMARNIMVEAGQHCATSDATEAEMLYALQCAYGLKDPNDVRFVKAREDCMALRETVKSAKPLQGPSLEDFNKLKARIAELNEAVDLLATSFVQYKQQRH